MLKEEPLSNRWLIKSEPFKYAWADLVRDGETVWDGVRNHLAAMNLRAMNVGDPCFFYHSNEGLQIVGVAEISATGLIDPTDADGKWPTVKVKPVSPLANPVTLKAIKANPTLEGIDLIRLSRLSVAQIRLTEWEEIIRMSEG